MPINANLVSFSFSISLEYDMIHRRRIIFDIYPWRIRNKMAKSLLGLVTLLTFEVYKTLKKIVFYAYQCESCVIQLLNIIRI